MLPTRLFVEIGALRLYFRVRFNPGVYNRDACRQRGPSRNMEAGIVGLPNVGKSTLFNALTAAGIASENYPFCTIEPNVGAVAIPAPRLATINRYIETEKIIPAIFQLVDIAGLVRGASQGEGLGNKFLANLRNVDAILH